ncbi:MAG: methyltransferase domain-containing protein [Deltaproteobacteria bacterium]|nr:methyltransferase domain-containing protein [Deltaproteobacteria bacterium]
MNDKPKENWGSAGPYERYVGRWSRKVAEEFLDWISVPSGAAWADVGCGTGVLVECILAKYEPKSIAAIDKAEGFVAEARRNITEPRVSFKTGDAAALSWDMDTFDAAVSGLVLNFVSDHKAMASEMARVTKPGGKVAAYVWDYGRGMQIMRQFWDAAIAVSPHDSKLDQAERFPICQPEPLEALFRDIGLRSVSCRAIDVPTVFHDFEDFWSPFLGKQGAAPTYLASVDDATRERIRALLKSRLVPTADGKIALTARAWAVQGIV